MDDRMWETAEWRYAMALSHLESDLRNILCQIMGLMSPYALDTDQLMAAKATVAVLEAAEQLEVWREAARDHAFNLMRPIREGQAQPSSERLG